MNMNIFNLYWYQEDQIDFLLAKSNPNAPNPRWKMLISATSSGKSAAMKAAALCAMARGTCKTVVVLTSRRSLEENLKKSETYIRESGEHIVFESHRWTELRRSAEAMWKPGTMGVWTQQGAVRHGLPPEGTDLSHVMIIVDEAHHHGEGTELYKYLVGAWARGATIWSFTGTPERSDGLSLTPVEPEVIILSQATLMRLGWPKKVLLHSLAMRSVAGTRAKGKLEESDYVSIVAELMANDRRTLIQVTPGQSTLLAGELAKRLTDHMEAHRITDNRILVATGDEPVNTPSGPVQPGVYIEKMLAEDRARLAAGDVNGTVRFVIDCRRLVEGADAPGLSRLVSYGVPKSVLIVIQSIGRIMRRKDKIPGFNPEHRDTVQVVFLVPDGINDVRAHKAAVEQYILISCYLNNPSVAHDYAEFWADAVRGQRLPPSALQFIRARDILPEAEANLRRRLLELGVPSHGRRHTSLREFISRVEVHVKDPKEAVDLVDRFMQYGAEIEPKLYELMKQVSFEVLQVSIPSGTSEERKAVAATYSNALLARFKQIAETHGDVCVPIKSKLLDGVGGVLTADTIEQIGREMAQARDAVKDLTVEKIADVITRFRAARGRPIGTVSGVVDDLSEFVEAIYTAKDLDRSIRRQWPGMDMHSMSVLNRANALVGTVDQKALAAAWGQHPAISIWDTERIIKQGAGGIQVQIERKRPFEHHLNGESEICLAIACKYGWRGFKKGISLGDALAAARGE